jgi:hypothetical protein
MILITDIVAFLLSFRVRLQADKIDPVPSTNVTIYERHPTELFGKEIATSGPYTNVIQVKQKKTRLNDGWKRNVTYFYL